MELNKQPKNLWMLLSILKQHKMVLLPLQLVNKLHMQMLLHMLKHSMLLFQPLMIGEL